LTVSPCGWLSLEASVAAVPPAFETLTVTVFRIQAERSRAAAMAILGKVTGFSTWTGTRSAGLTCRASS
jgi:hypothetical protein